jgi:hypothetical protein
MQNAGHCCPILINLEFFLTDFSKSSESKISGKSIQRQPSYSMRKRGRAYGRTDRETDKHDEANSRFSQRLKSA